MILQNISKILNIFIIFFGIYVQLRAESAIGGGFQSGLIFACGLILNVIAGNKSLPIWIFKKIAALGVLIYFGVGIFSLLYGGSFLDYNYLSSDHVFGQKLGIFIVEIGVSMTVFSTISMIYLMMAKK